MMNRLQAEGFFLDGDLDSLNKLRPSGILISDLFIDCLNHARGSDLDRMIRNCLGLCREQYATAAFFGVMEENDVDYRARAISLATTLDAFARKLSGNILPGDEELMDKWALQSKRSSCAHVWVTYSGLFEKFEYCNSCNEKRTS